MREAQIANLIVESYKRRQEILTDRVGTLEDKVNQLTQKVACIPNWVFETPCCPPGDPCDLGGRWNPRP